MRNSNGMVGWGRRVGRSKIMLILYFIYGSVSRYCFIFEVDNYLK